MNNEKRPHACLCGGCKPSTYLLQPITDPIALEMSVDREGCQACGACTLSEAAPGRAAASGGTSVSDDQLERIVGRVVAEVLKRLK